MLDEIKRGDRYDIDFIISDRNGVVNLAGAVIVLTADLRNPATAAVILSAAITGPGTITHTLDGSLDTVGVWDLEIKITRGAEVAYAPTRRYIELRVGERKTA